MLAAPSTIGLALAALSAASAFGQEAQPSKRADPTPLSEVTVVAPDMLSGLEVNGRRRCILRPPPGDTAPRPHVVDTYPKPGQTVPPGRLYVRVTFSERMSPCGFLIGSPAFTPEPEFLDEPAMLTRDYKTFYFAVSAEPARVYGMRFNTLLAHNFRSLYGVVAPAYSLSFRSSAGPPAATMAQAMAADPFSEDFVQHPDRLLILWTPRENGEGPDCGSCDDTESSLKLGPPLAPAVDGGG